MQSGFTASEIVKQYKYRTAGVREYWIVNPMTKTVTVYDFEDESGTNQYTFDDEISVRIYRNLVLRISGLP
jgi:Uma2 family endonuclease